MAKMTAAQITAELQRKAAAGETKSSSAANQAQLNAIIAANKAAATAKNTTNTGGASTQSPILNAPTYGSGGAGMGVKTGGSAYQPAPYEKPSSGGGSATTGGVGDTTSVGTTTGGGSQYVPGSQQQLTNVQTDDQGKTMYTQKAGGNATQLLYLKKLYAGADASPQQKAWAAAQAKQLYSSDPSLANFQSMNAQQMNDYINGGQGGAGFGGAQVDLYNQDDPSFGKAVDNSLAVMEGNGQTDLFDQYNQNVSDYGNAATNPSDPYWDNIKEMANSLGSAEYTQKKDSFQNLLNNLSAQQKSDLDAILGNLTNAENRVSDNTFQDWLQARQNLSSRGMSGTGSGFQQDADIRLQMNKQNALGDLYTSANQNIGKTNAQYGEKLANAQQQLSGLNLNSLQQQQFQQLFDGSSKNLLEMAKVYAGLTGKQMPYAQFTGKDLLDSNFNYDKLNTEDKQFYAKLDQDYNLKMTDMMGKDAQGNPTLDTNKFLADVALKQASLNEKIQHNRTTEAISVNSAMLRDAQATNKLSASIANNQAKIQLAVAQLNSKNANSQNTLYAKAVGDKVKAIGDQLGQMVGYAKAFAGKGLDVPPEIAGAIDSLSKQYNIATTGFDTLLAGSRPAGMSGGTVGDSPVSGNLPME